MPNTSALYAAGAGTLPATTRTCPKGKGKGEGWKGKGKGKTGKDGYKGYPTK